ncbi:MAG TPA: flagellar protein FlgN [Thermodesulfovibrionales bacterium]|nr:flagellar protein FlgN [Thermodesulfovibrionales bacterium]
MNTLDRIKDILVEQINGYRILLDLLQKERESVLSLDTNRVESISKEKDTVIIRLRLTEDERVRLLDKFAAENNLPRNFSLQSLIETTGDDGLEILRMQLVSLVQSIDELNKFNMVLIGRSLNFVRHSMAFFESLGLDVDQLNRRRVFSAEI